MLIFGLLAGLAFVGLWRACSSPSAWQARSVRTAAERQEVAASVERTLQHAAKKRGQASPDMHRVGGPTERLESSTRATRAAGQEPVVAPQADSVPVQRVTLTLDEVSAWAQEWADRRLAGQGPDSVQLGDVFLAPEEDHLLVMAQLTSAKADLLLGLPLEVQVENGTGQARLLGVRLGNLPLPGVDALPRLLRSLGDPNLDRAADRAEELSRGLSFDPVLPMEDGNLRVLSLELDGNLVHLEVESL